jgi:hypothetical protein
MGEAEGSREARAILCGSMVYSRGLSQARRDDVEWWIPAVSDGSTRGQPCAASTVSV